LTVSTVKFLGLFIYSTIDFLLVTTNKEFIVRILKIKRKFERQYEADYMYTNITSSQALLLEEIYTHEGISAYQLSDSLGYDRSLVTKNLKELNKNGFIIVSPIDKRTNSIRASDKGKELIEKGQESGKAYLKEIFVGCTEEEMEEFFRILDKLDVS